MSRRRLHLLAAALLLALVLASTALAAAPKPGTYKATIASTVRPIAFSLKLSGARVGPVKISDIPIYCQGGGPPIPRTFPTVRLSSTGTFTTRTTFRPTLGPLKGKVTSRLTITGRFTRSGRMRGRIKVVDITIPNCGGSTTFTATRR